MNEITLEKLGLTKGEVKVYLALNKLGEASIGPIVKDSKVSKSKIYDILQRLADKGLVGHIVKEQKRYYLANDPTAVVDFVEKKENELKTLKGEVQQLVPELKLLRSLSGEKRTAEVYEGFKGLRNIREQLLAELKSGDTLMVLGAPKIANEKWESWFLNFHKRRIERKIKLEIIYNSDALKYGEIRKKMELTKVRYLPNNLVSPNWVDVFPTAVLFVAILDTPIAFLIRNKELAESFASYFKIMWNNSKNQELIYSEKESSLSLTKK
ncbi:hypothetical protein J4417_03830 [Candidatus Woesearchaeota archaeon]|nr:hypothetical protein [Candidatus Woesearchaeota archaeon]